MYHIRKATAEDTVAISRLISSLSQYFLLDSEGEGAEVFLNSINPEAIARCVTNPEMHYLVATENNHIIGAGAFKNGSHLYHLFVAKSHHNLGVAKAIWQTLVTSIDKSLEITVNSTSFAVPVYQSFGFKITGQKVEKNGIAYVPMSLAPAETNC